MISVTFCCDTVSKPRGSAWPIHFSEKNPPSNVPYARILMPRSSAALAILAFGRWSRMEYCTWLLTILMPSS